MARKIINQSRWVFSLALVLVFSGAVVAHAQRPAGTAAEREPNNKTISMDFDQVDIKVFIKFISELTGKNFVIDDKVRGKVTVLSPSKISVEEAYKVFESVLEVNGFTTVPAGKVIKVVPSVEARQKNVELYKAPLFVPRPDDRIITQIVPLVYADSQEVRKLLAPLVSKQGVVIAYEATDALIITDFQSNIQRLLSIIEEIDVEFLDAGITVLPVEYASAENLADNLSKLLEVRQKPIKGRRAGPPLKIIPYERMKMLIILADRQNTRMIQELVKTLDQPSPKGSGNIQVVYLENAQADDLAKVLTGLPSKAPTKGEQPIISTEVKIVADKATNSLVITAKPDEFQVLEPIIQQLDIPRKQVYVEALIMEVSPTKTTSLGVNWTVADQQNLPHLNSDGVVFGGSNPGGGVSVLDAAGQLALPAGLAAGVVAFPVTIGGITFSNLAALIQAAQTNDEFNIIATPQLMTLDNEEATVVVAENIPFSTRVDQGTATNDRAIQSFEYRDVGVTLKVTPQINEKRFVKLKIFEEVSRVVQESVRTGVDQVVLAPTTRKRTAETNVQVKDGQTVVIAGLVGEDVDSSVSKVPCLGDIPLLGWLFRSESTTSRRTNLLVFLTPYIVASPQEAEMLYQKKSDLMNHVLQDAGREGSVGDSVGKEEQTPAPGQE